MLKAKHSYHFRTKPKWTIVPIVLTAILMLAGCMKNEAPAAETGKEVPPPPSTMEAAATDPLFENLENEYDARLSLIGRMSVLRIRRPLKRWLRARCLCRIPSRILTR